MERAKGFIEKNDDSRVYNFFAGLLTFLFVCFCWIFFKSPDYATASIMVSQIFTDFSFSVWPAFWGTYHNVIWIMLLGYALHMVPETLPGQIMERTRKLPMAAFIITFIIFLVVYAQFKSSTPVMPIYLKF